MRTNSTKAKLAEGKPVFGAVIAEYALNTVEMFGALGYDYVFLDGEHGSLSLEHMENLIRAAEVFGITPICRVPNHMDSTILQFLDRGAQGIIVPHVNTREQAEAVARACRYHPEGHRGIGGARAHDYNVAMPREQSARFINSQILVITMIEEVEAVNNIEEIAKVPGVDIMHVASGDLTQSMGNPGQVEVWRMIDGAIRRIRAAGKYAGAGGNSPAQTARVAQLIKTGANFITIQALDLTRLAAENFRKQVNAAL